MVVIATVKSSILWKQDRVTEKFSAMIDLILVGVCASKLIQEHSLFSGSNAV